MNKHSTSGRVVVLAVIAALMIFIIAGVALKRSMSGEQSGGNVIETASIAKAIEKAPFEIIIPDTLYPLLKGKEAQVVNGQMFSIEGAGITYKVAPFVDEKADVLGIYEAAKEEKELYAKDSKLRTQYVRYRSFEDATALNWVCNDVMYGLWIGEQQTFDYMIDFLEIDTDNYSAEEKTIVSIEDMKEEDIQFERYQSSVLGASFDMPVVNSDVAVQSGENFITITYDFKNVFTIMKNVNMKMESTQEYIIEELGNGYTLQYYAENQFSDVDRAYNDYEVFLRSVDRIKDSFEVSVE